MGERPRTEIIVADTQELVQQSLKIRFDVFVHEQKFPEDTELDEYDDNCTHLLLRLTPSLIPVGVVRLVPLHGQYKLTRLAVLSEYRKLRFGNDLMIKSHEWIRSEAKKQGLASVDVKIHSQIPVKSFYRRHGYTDEGPEFMEEGAPHQLMRIHLVV